MSRTGWQFTLATAILLVGIPCCSVGLTLRPPPTAPCEIETLLVDESVLPMAWEQQGPPRAKSAPVRFGVERIGTVFSTPTFGGGLQHIYRARDKREATKGYHDFVGDFFSTRDTETEWEIPPEITFRSQVADQDHLGCSTHIRSSVRRCQFIAQYEVYIVRFDADMSEVMTYAGFERILQDIDSRMTQCLNR